MLFSFSLAECVENLCCVVCAVYCINRVAALAKIKPPENCDTNSLSQNLRSMVTPLAVFLKTGFPNVIAPVMVKASEADVAVVDDEPLTVLDDAS